MTFDDVVAELRHMYSINPPAARLSRTDVVRWATGLQVTESELFDRISKYIALGFYRAELTFDYCNNVMNAVFGGVIFPNKQEIPPFFWSVFLAFESGECVPRNDPGCDPVATYTRPLIAKIVEENLTDQAPDTTPDK